MAAAEGNHELLTIACEDLMAAFPVAVLPAVGFQQAPEFAEPHRVGALG